MDKKQMIFKLKQLAHNQNTIYQVFIEQGEDDRAEIARVKRVMYENFAELLESWLEAEV